MEPTKTGRFRFHEQAEESTNACTNITRVVNAKQWLEQIHANRTINAYYVV